MLTVFFQESFEATAPNYDTGGGAVTVDDGTPFGDATSLGVWNRVGSRIVGNPGNETTAYSNVQGTSFWAADGLSQSPDGTVSSTGAEELLITGIDVSSHVDITFLGHFAADGQSGSNHRFDPEDYLIVEWRVDGGAWQNGLAWENDESGILGTSPPNNERLLRDTDFDGIGDGAILGPTFGEFTFSMGPGSIGNTVDLRVRVHVNDMTEEVAFDNLRLDGTFSVSNTAPTVSGHVAPNVGEPEIGATAYTFDVTYSDNSAVSVVSGAQERKQRRILGNLEQLPIALRPTPGWKVEANHLDFAKERF